MKIQWWLQPGTHETVRMRTGDPGRSRKSALTATRRLPSFWLRGLLGVILVLIVVGLVSGLGEHRHPPERKQRVTLVTFAGPITGYVYDCRVQCRSGRWLGTEVRL
jgi:hypothetical protein